MKAHRTAKLKFCSLVWQIDYAIQWLTDALPDVCATRGRTQWGACWCSWRLRVVGWPRGWWQAAPGGVRSAGCWRNGSRFNAQILSRKRGNLSIADDTRTDIQHRTLHTQFVSNKGAGPPTTIPHSCCASPVFPPFVVGVCMRAAMSALSSGIENSLLFNFASKASGPSLRRVVQALEVTCGV